MIVKIVGASVDSFSKLYRKDENEYIIGCDGGINVLNHCKIAYDVAIGDFDSALIDNVAREVETIKFKPEKDESDLELALRHAQVLNPDRIEIYNVTGNRLDHFYAALNLIKQNPGKVIMYDSNNEIFSSNSNEFLKDDYKYISFFSIYSDTVISLEGFKYNLNNYNLSLMDSLCLSNEIISVGKMSTNHPVLVIKSK